MEMKKKLYLWDLKGKALEQFCLLLVLLVLVLYSLVIISGMTKYYTVFILVWSWMMMFYWTESGWLMVLLNILLRILGSPKILFCKASIWWSTSLLLLSTVKWFVFWLVAKLIIGILYDWCWAGWIVSSLLAGATVGSFTGGALADKFGRTRTFQLDAIPLAIGAFLW